MAAIRIYLAYFFLLRHRFACIRQLYSAFAVAGGRIFAKRPVNSLLNISFSSDLDQTSQTAELIFQLVQTGNFMPDYSSWQKESWAGSRRIKRLRKLIFHGFPLPFLTFWKEAQERNVLGISLSKHILCSHHLKGIFLMNRTGLRK